MAIAYYIPDQAKLLAGSQRFQERTTTSSNPSNQPMRGSAPSSNPANNRGFGTTINITMPTYAAPPEPSGCWDFLTQVFCQALSFYHESSRLQPTVIQIAVNLNLTNAEETTSVNVSSTQTASAETSSTLNNTRTPTEDTAAADHDNHTHGSTSHKKN